MKMRVLAGLVGLLFATQAAAQVQLGAGQVYGNNTAARAPAQGASLTSIIDQAMGSTRGSILERGASGWAPIVPGTVGLPFVSAGAGADPLYQALGATGGGTGQTVYVIGDVLQASSTTALSRLAAVATGNALISGGVGTVSSWGKIGISTHVSGLGTGVATALAVNVGSAGAFVTFNGALGTPSSGTLTSATGLPISTGVSGLAAGCATFLGTATSANLRGCITDESGTGVAYFQGGDIGTPSAGVATNITALNATQLTTGTVPAARTNGHQNGTATNDSGAAGEIGEFISQTVLAGAAVSNTTATARDVTSISLTAGDWDVFGNVVFAPNAATIPTVLGCWISVTSGTLPTAPNEGSEFFQQLAFTTGATQFFPCGQKRISVSGTTTVFLSSFATFTVNIMQSYGFVGARRAR